MEGGLKLDSLYGKVANIAATQQDGAYHNGQVASNPFDFQASHDINSQYNMALVAPPDIQNQNALCVPPAQINVGGMPYQDYYMTQQQQQEPSMVIKKSTNPFD